MNQDEKDLSYNKLYYQKNRDRILEKARQKRLQAKLEDTELKNRRRIYRAGYYHKNKEIIAKRAAAHALKTKNRFNGLKLQLERSMTRYNNCLESYRKVKKDISSLHKKKKSIKQQIEQWNERKIRLEKQIKSIRIKKADIERQVEEIRGTRRKYRQKYISKNKDKIIAKRKSFKKPKVNNKKLNDKKKSFKDKILCDNTIPKMVIEIY